MDSKLTGKKTSSRIANGFQVNFRWLVALACVCSFLVSVAAFPSPALYSARSAFRIHAGNNDGIRSRSSNLGAPAEPTRVFMGRDSCHPLNLMHFNRRNIGEFCSPGNDCFLSSLSSSIEDFPGEAECKTKRQLPVLLRNFMAIPTHMKSNAWARKISQQFRMLRTKFSRCLSTLLFSLALSLSSPLTSHATTPNQYSSSRTSSSSLNHRSNNDYSKRSTISVRAQSSQPYSTTSRRRSSIASRQNYRRKNRTQMETAQRLAFFIVGGSIAGTSFRASRITGANNGDFNNGVSSGMRKGRRVRTTTPFGIIRNLSPLGNGVSVIRVRMALEFGGVNHANNHETHDDVDDGDVKQDVYSVLTELDNETKSFQDTIMLPTLQGVGQSGAFRQRAMGSYLSNVSSLLRQYQATIKYGSIDSIRMPFVEEAIGELQRVVKEERDIYSDQQQDHLRRIKGNSKSLSDTNHGDSKGYILTTMLLAIKGDHTTIPLPFGLSQQKEMGRALKLIQEDVLVEDCLVGSEVLCLPSKQLVDLQGEDDNMNYDLLSKEDIIEIFPGLSRLA